jgi:hypothetical protein
MTKIWVALESAMESFVLSLISFHPVWYTSVPDFPKNNIFSVVLHSLLQLVCNCSKKNLFYRH